MRIRSIKPEFWRSDDIASLDWEARLFFIGLWSYVDDNGVGIDRLASIAADLFSGDLEHDPPETFARVSRGLQELSEAGRITRYTVEKKAYLEITNWSKHQRIDKPNKPRFPRSDNELAICRESVARVAEKESSGTEEQRNRGTGEQGIKASAPSVLDEFEEAWKHWPKKVEKKQALEQYRKAIKKVKWDFLLDAIQRFGDAYAVTTDRQFVPALGVWLNRERWTDELPTAPNQQGRPTKTEQTIDVLEMGRQLLNDQKAIGQ